MPLVEIACFADGSLAEIVRGRLVAEGIDAVLFDGGLAGLGLGNMAPARLMVEERDRVDAERVIAA